MASQTPVKPDLDLRRQTTLPQLNNIAYQGKKQALLTATNPTAFFLSLKPQSTRQKPSKLGTIKQHWAGSVGTWCTRVKHILDIPSSGNYLPKHLPNSQRNCRKTLVRTTRVANKMFVQIWTYVKICGDNRWNLHGNKKPEIKQSSYILQTWVACICIYRYVNLHMYMWWAHSVICSTHPLIVQSPNPTNVKHAIYQSLNQSNSQSVNQANQSINQAINRSSFLSFIYLALGLIFVQHCHDSFTESLFHSMK